MPYTFALAGNPNVGKTALFNALTGLAHTTGNYPGTTVEKRHGKLALPGGIDAEIVDLPGTYSLAARSPDEIIVVDVLLCQQVGEVAVEGILVVLDAANLERNLYFFSQLVELGKPMIAAVNMMDIARRRGIEINFDALERALGVPVVPVCANKGEGFNELRELIARMARGEVTPPESRCVFAEDQYAVITELIAGLNQHAGEIGRPVQPVEAQRILVDSGGYAELRLLKRIGPDFSKQLGELRQRAQPNGSPLPLQEARARYAWVKDIMDAAVKRPDIRTKTRSERIDDVLTHPIAGGAIFLVIMMVVFQAIYAWAGPLMDLIDGTIGGFGDWLGASLPEGMLQSLVVDGVIAGVGGVLIFLPQILILSLLIAFLEDCGYMARAAFLMDRLLSWCGLSGQSFIPMMSSFACAIPGIMATRTIPNRNDRFATILVAPLMSCSARLPVYTIMIGAFIPAYSLFGGLIGLQGLTLFAMYSLGAIVAIPVAWILKKTIFKGHKPPFIMEMPSYKIPQAKAVLFKVYRDGKEFVVRAGTLIFAVTVVLWALAYFPRDARIGEDFAAKRAAVESAALAPEAQTEQLDHLNKEESGAYLRDSYLGHAGHFIEPLFTPMGWDWRIATAVIASFPAREVVIASLGTIFNLGTDTDEESTSLRDTLKQATRADGGLLFNIPVALSIMVFFALCSQCGATLVTMKRETGQWRWPLFAFTYMTALAYVAAAIVYQTASLIGGSA